VAEGWRMKGFAALMAMISAEAASMNESLVYLVADYT
jgi:hypothetical protein